MPSIKTTLPFLLVLAASPGASSAPTYDSSGNGLLSGAYNVRQIIPTGPISGVSSAAIQGTITFDGSGSYTFSGTNAYFDKSGVISQTITGSGTYVISASGEGYITAISPQVSPTDQIVGLVSHGIFIGSTTENSPQATNSEYYTDLFIAAPVGSPAATNAT